MEREDFRKWNGRGGERERGWNVEGSKRGLRNFFCFSPFSSSSSSFLFLVERNRWCVFVCDNDFH